MRKVVVVLFAVLVVGAAIGTGGYFGLGYWAHAAAVREVDATLGRWRTAGGAATRGPVEVDLWTRAVRVRDVVLTAPASPNDKIEIAEVVASGIDTAGGASRLEIIGLQMEGAVPGLFGSRVQQKSPRITLTGYSGRPPASRGGTTALDTMRIWLEQFSAITAETIEIPSFTVTASLGGGRGPANASDTTEYTYSNLLLRNVATGRIAEATMDGIAMRSTVGTRAFTGEVGKTTVTGIDLGPVLAALDASRSRNEGYQRVYGKLSMGPYALRFSDGGAIAVDELVAEDIGLYPAKFSLDDLLFLTEVSTTTAKASKGPPSSTQISMMMDKLAGLYEVIHIGKFELLGMRVNAPHDQVSFGRLALNGLDNGRLAEFTLEKLAGTAAGRGQVLDIGGLSFKGFRLADLFRTTSTQLAALSGPQQPQDPAQVLRALALLEGMELREMTVPDPKTGRLVHLETFTASWGQLVEGIPSQIRASAKIRVPISATDPEPFMQGLAARGIPAVALSLDIGSTWTESTQTLALAPATLEMSDVFAMSIKAELGNVPREAFSSDLMKAMASVALVEAGPIEISVRDLGAVDRMAADLGRTSGGGAEAGRILLAATLAQQAAVFTQKRPEMQPFFDALSGFVQRKGQTMTVTLTPKGRVGILPLVEGTRRDPLATLLDGFTLDARTDG